MLTKQGFMDIMDIQRKQGLILQAHHFSLTFYFPLGLVVTENSWLVTYFIASLSLKLGGFPNAWADTFFAKIYCFAI